ncbi:hypothetical protein [Rhodococcus sp. JS3073]|uniref:hypothetical protein n=1 Tax=Rhodococcus sp. JS3073 TaxID=3002901 RepID=UPI002285DF00|nr:hypothetical protein [Rhodococcus sp. JS3073]WAM16331.1 hypothetical protein OYT95_06830 [Rhodococcus sp. JS3073]
MRLFGVVAWHLTPQQSDRYFAGPGKGSPSTVRSKVSRIDGYFVFLEQRYAGEIGHRFGVLVESPVDEFNRPVHRGDFGLRIPPSQGGHAHRPPHTQPNAHPLPQRRHSRADAPLALSSAGQMADQPPSASAHLDVRRPRSEHPPLAQRTITLIFRGLDLQAHRVRSDRILYEASVTEDPVLLMRVFGISTVTAMRYLHAAHPHRSQPPH